MLVPTSACYAAVTDGPLYPGPAVRCLSKAVADQLVRRRATALPLSMSTQVPRMLRRLSPTQIQLVAIALLVVLWLALGLWDLYRHHAL